LQILTFNIDEDLGLVEPFMKEKGYTFPVMPAFSNSSSKNLPLWNRNTPSSEPTQMVSSLVLLFWNLEARKPRARVPETPSPN